MQKNPLVAVLVAAMLLGTPALADQKANTGNGQGNAQSAKNKCPPGLVKKGNGCVAPDQGKKPGQAKTSDEVKNPGQAKKADKQDVFPVDHHYARGDRLPNDDVVLLDPRRFALNHNSLFVLSGDYLYLLDRTTGNIVNPLGPLRDWNWAWQDTDFQNCPPGLAKKNPPCVPPGLAKDGALAPDPYPIGAHLPDGYHVVIDPAQYDPNDEVIYTRRGDTIYRVDRQNNQVLDLIGTISDLLN